MSAKLVFTAKNNEKYLLKFNPIRLSGNTVDIEKYGWIIGTIDCNGKFDDWKCALHTPSPETLYFFEYNAQDIYTMLETMYKFEKLASKMNNINKINMFAWENLK